MKFRKFLELFIPKSKVNNKLDLYYGLNLSDPPNIYTIYGFLLDHDIPIQLDKDRNPVIKINVRLHLYNKLTILCNQLGYKMTSGAINKTYYSATITLPAKVCYIQYRSMLEHIANIDKVKADIMLDDLLCLWKGYLSWKTIAGEIGIKQNEITIYANMKSKDNVAIIAALTNAYGGIKASYRNINIDTNLLYVQPRVSYAPIRITAEETKQ